MKVCLGGAGSLGTAFLAALLESSLLVEELHLIDFDVVELANTGNQVYREQEVGQRKVDALAEILVERGFAGRVFRYFVDINHPKTVLSQLGNVANCNVFVSAFDTFQSRVSFYYYVVQECASSRLYLDGGIEGYKAHCFYTSNSSPCIYCLRWLFPEERRYFGVCSLGGRESVELSREKLESTVLTILGKELTDRYKNTVEKFNTKYKDRGIVLTEADVKNIEKSLLPTIPPVATILASLMVMVVKKHLDTPSAFQKNFILYAGDAQPLFHAHSLEKDPSCFVCSAGP
ncbi:ubiquitin-activating enzyme E1 C [Nematocida displodere]|uniref:NEDD8-activating enzyme E1 catalytic subunit n=1 Tax=Nematocida displodere TaxID=1805483 RepID=A0A177EAM1_9MICR|nr:ubiquitin-activating enzyme E1 C [Nematocida displodere]